MSDVFICTPMICSASKPNRKFGFELKYGKLFSHFLMYLIIMDYPFCFLVVCVCPFNKMFCYECLGLNPWLNMLILLYCAVADCPL